ncbi:MAG: transposon-encoded TnpW family protein [Defluviitaleaceae bacterium]|nr:transposon-encoded TnpW family protein [Defluviitaleaceae bacterium]
MIRENIITETNPTATGDTTVTAVATATAITAAQSYFSRKIGNTTFVVSVAFSGKSNESIEDKILRLVASDYLQTDGQQGEVQQCG